MKNTSKGIAGPVSFVVVGSLFLFGIAFIEDEVPPSNPLSDAVNVPDTSSVDDPANANLIDKAVATVQNMVAPFIGISSSIEILNIIFTVLKAGIAVSMALILKDLVPFT